MQFNYWQPFLQKQRGQRGQKRHFSRTCRFFIFMGLFSLDSSLQVLTDLMLLLPFPRYKGSKGANAQNHNFLISSQILTNCFKYICLDEYKKNGAVIFGHCCKGITGANIGTFPEW